MTDSENAAEYSKFDHHNSPDSIPMNFLQKQIMLDYFKTHPYLMRLKETDTFSKQDSVLLWSELAQKLNEVPGVVSNPSEQWKSIWSDFHLKLSSSVKESLTGIDHDFLSLLNKVNNMSFNELFKSSAERKIDPELRCEDVLTKDEKPKSVTQPDLTDSPKSIDHVKPISEAGFSTLQQYEVKISTQFTRDTLQSSSTEEGTNKLDPPKIIIIKPRNLSKTSATQGGDSQTQNPTLGDPISVSGPRSSPVLEKALIKKLVKSDLIKVRYLKQKLKMEGEYHKRKLSLMKDLLMIKQRKVRVEEKQATALLSIARSLDRMVHNHNRDQQSLLR